MHTIDSILAFAVIILLSGIILKRIISRYRSSRLNRKLQARRIQDISDLLLSLQKLAPRGEVMEELPRLPEGMERRIKEGIRDEVDRAIDEISKELAKNERNGTVIDICVNSLFFVAGIVIGFFIP